MIKEALDFVGNNGLTKIRSDSMDPSEFLQSLVDEEYLNNSALISSANLIVGYKDSARFRQTFMLACQEFIRPDADLNDLLNRLAGKMFQDIGVMHNQAQAAKGPYRVILDSDQAFRLYRCMYPESVVKEHPLGLTSLAGISVPDAVVVEQMPCTRPVIVKLIDYALGPADDKHRQGLEIDKRDFPRLFSSQAHLTVVLPEQHPDYNAIRENPFVAIRTLPVNIKVMGKLTSEIYCRHRLSDDHPTLKELINRVNYQVDRGSEYLMEKSPRFTPEYKLYLQAAIQKRK